MIAIVLAGIMAGAEVELSHEEEEGHGSMEKCVLLSLQLSHTFVLTNGINKPLGKNSY